MQISSKLTRLMAGVAIAATTAVAGYAAEVTLTISSWAPPTHAINAILWPEMIKEIEAATDGRVTAKIVYGLASPPAQYDLVQDGAADITWIFHGYTPGRFVATKLIELPGYTGNAEAASVAYWRAYKKYFAKLDEHRGVKLAALMTHGPGVLHSDKKVEHLSQISGMKLRIGGGVAGDVGAALGATGINIPAPKVYETLASHAADGVFMPMEGTASFKLFEVAPNVFTVPGGFYRGSFAIIMNQDKFDSLSAADQAGLNKVFGENLSRVGGAVWDQADAVGLAALKSHPDNTLTEANAEDVAKWNAITKPIIAKVLAEVSAKGVDAVAARDFIAKQMKNY